MSALQEKIRDIYLKKPSILYQVVLPLHLVSWYKSVMNNNRVNFSRPKDQSLEAYKAWIKEVTFKLTGKNDDSMTEEKWVIRWKEFWSKPDKKDE
jgi:hypothetical protein